jgi:hypothetical protein
VYANPDAVPNFAPEGNAAQQRNIAAILALKIPDEGKATLLAKLV